MGGSEETIPGVGAGTGAGPSASGMGRGSELEEGSERLV